MKIYISLPISGRSIEDVKAEIETVSAAIRKKGHEPVSPLDGVTDYGLPWIDYMVRDLKILSKCEAVCFVPGLDFSFGVQIERLAATKMKKRLIDFIPFNNTLIGL